MTEVNDPRAAKRAALRRATLQLFAGALGIHVVMFAIYYFAGIEHSAPKTRLYFTGAWTIVTLMVVLPLLKRVRRVRFS